MTFINNKVLSINIMVFCLQTLYHLGQVKESVPHFHKALAVLRNKQPSSKAVIKIYTMKETLTQWRHLRSPTHFHGNARQV